MVTVPDVSLIRHDAHVPERHALSMSTPASSATSRIVKSSGTGLRVSDARNVTVPETAAVRALFAVGSRVTVPKASVLISPGRAPSPSKSRLTSSIMDGGPQTCARRRAISGTHSMRAGLQRLHFFSKNEIARTSEAEDQVHLPRPSGVAEIPHHSHHWSNTHSRP